MKIFPPRSGSLRRLLVPGLLAVSTALGAPLMRDLGQGLGYARVHALPGDLPAAAARPRPLVLDLRFATGDEGAASALAGWLKLCRRDTAPVFVLVNAGTAPAILGQLAAIGPLPGLLTLGAGSPQFTPDIPLKISAAAERAAYEALEHGTDSAVLITENAAKPRHDESTLAQEQANPAAGGVTGEDDEPADPADAGAAPPPPPPHDLALQRAVHLHRALLALKKIPAA